MRHLSIGFPSKVKIVSRSTEQEAVRFRGNMSAGYSVEIVGAKGEILDGDSLYIEASAGNISGTHRLRADDAGEGAMPAVFSDGLSVRYKYGSDAPDWLNMTGQSSKGVKECESIRFIGLNGLTESITYDDSRLLSYNGYLYMFVEYIDLVRDERKIRIYKAVNSNDFKYHYEFPQAVGTPGAPGWDFHPGASVCAVEYKGKMLVAYRRLIGEKVYISVFESSEGDGLDWVELSNIEVKGATAKVKEVRIRIAANQDSIMLVYCTSYSELLSGSEMEDYADFRYYISYNDGNTFIDPEDAHKEAAGGTQAVTGARLTSLVPFFRDSEASPNYTNMGKYTGSEPISTGFDLYFDKDMGSFVILKASDSPKRIDGYGRRGNTKLIGIKTVAGNISEWEKCLDLRMDHRMNGVLTYDREALRLNESKWVGADGFNQFDPFQLPISPHDPSKPLGFGGEFGYTILDVEVVPGQVTNDIVLHVTQGFREYLSLPSDFDSLETGYAVGEFRFTDAGLRVSGGDSGRVAYGSSSHEEYTFTCTLLSHLLSGFAHRGVPSNISISDGYSNPYIRLSGPVTAVRHRHELILKRSGSPFGFFYIKAGPLSNIGETKGYELYYPGAVGKVEMVGATLVNNMTQLGDSARVETPGGAFSGGYISLDERQLNFPVGTYPYNSILRYVALTREKYIKVKFSCRMDEARVFSQNEFTLFDLLINGDKQDPFTDIRVRLNTVKSVGSQMRTVNVVFGSAPDEQHVGSIIDQLDLTIETEFFIAHSPVIPTTQADSLLFIFYRQKGDRNWKFGAEFETPLVTRVAPQDVSLRFSYLRIGMVSVQNSTHAEGLNVYDFAVSSLGAGARAVYTDSAKLHDRMEVEPFTKRRLIAETSPENLYVSNPIELFDRRLPVLDHSEVELVGGMVPRLETNKFVAENLSLRNPELAVLNGIADSVYDFTERWLAEPGFEIIVESEDMAVSDILTLVNINGVSSVTISAGTYNTIGESWISRVSSKYQLPSVQISVQDVDNRTVLFTGADFEPSQIAGYSFFSYNLATEVWEDCRLIIDNVGGVLKLDRPIDDMINKLDRQFFVVKNIMSFDVLDLVESFAGVVTHYSVSFDSADFATFRSVGEISFGKWIDLASHIVESSSKTSDNAKVVSSDFGHIYPSLVKKGNVIDDISLDFTYLQTHNGEASYVKEMLLSLRRMNRPFPFIEFHTDGQKVQYVALNGDISSSQEGYGEKLSSSLTTQAWFPKPVYREFEVDYSFNITAASAVGEDPVFQIGTPVAFGIVLDSAATLVGYATYWDLGDGVIIQDGTVHLAASNTYFIPGGKVITAKIMDLTGTVVAFRRKTIYIQE